MKNIIFSIFSIISWILVLVSSCYWHQNTGLFYIISQICFIAAADIFINYGIEIKNTDGIEIEIANYMEGWLLMIIGFTLIPLISLGLI